MTRAPDAAPARAPLRAFAAALVDASLLGFLAAGLTHAFAPDSDDDVVRHAYLGVGALSLFARAFWTPQEAFARLRVLAVNVLLTFALLEVGLALHASLAPSPLLYEEAQARDTIAAHALAPGLRVYGKPVNADGYYDDAFFAADEDDVVVALVADSFGIGVVPHDRNFATVAERRMAGALATDSRRVAVHGFAVPAIGPREYAWLVDNEVARVRPRLVVVNVFAGNDIEGLERERRQPWAPQRTRAWQLAARLVTLARNPEVIGTTQFPDRPYLAGREHEEPTFGEDEYLRIETARYRACCVPSRRLERRYAELARALDHLAASAGDAQLVVSLAPDEFQVNDALHARVVAGLGAGVEHERELPQRRIAAAAAERRIAFVDLLPALRLAEREAPAYHLRDTHWNAHGNRTAGEALADALLSILGE